MSWERNRLKLINRSNKWRRKSKSNNKKEKLVVNKKYKDKEVAIMKIIKIGENNNQLKNKQIRLSDMPVEVDHHHLQSHRLHQRVDNWRGIRMCR